MDHTVWCTLPSLTNHQANSYGAMDRIQSAPAAPSMEQTMSVSSDHQMQRSASTVSNWQSYDEQSNAYVFSDASFSRQQHLQPIDETIFSNDNMVEYSPADYVSNLVQSSDSPNMPLSHLQLTPNHQWMPSLDASTSPSTPSTALMTPVTLSSNSMSRQSSFNPLFVDSDISMLRSESSMYPIISDDGSLSYSPDVSHVQKGMSGNTDTLPFLSSTGFTGLSSETSFLSPVPQVSPASASALASPQDNSPCLEEAMQRSASTCSSGDSDASHASASTLHRSRHVRREREILAQAGSCRIAPKANPSATSPPPPSASPNAQMMRIQSEDGSSRQVGVISKAPYVRPQHPKILCPHCNERPEGFRGTHELDRHVTRAHSVVRKGYICVAPQFDKDFLQGCKHCRNRKVYGAYYNAAAHLRRAHFHPRKRGRKGKNDEKRGGIGGGDHPPMDYLKQHWIHEIEVDNTVKKAKSKAKSAAAAVAASGSQSPASPADSMAEMDADAFDAAFEPDVPFDAATAQQAQHAQQQHQAGSIAPIPLSSLGHNQFVDFAAYPGSPAHVFSPASAMMFAAQTQTQPQTQPDVSVSAPVEMSDFEFDAYRS